jgi:predicted secreted protein
MPSRIFLTVTVALLGAACGAEQPVAAEETFERVGFGVQRSREVENDWLIATIGVTHENEDPAALAARVNKDMRWALDIAKAEDRVDVRTGSYRTYPISDPERGTVRSWRGGQDLVIESGDSQALSELLGKLQARLALRGMQQSVSRARRESVEQELEAELLDAYRERAQRIAQHLGARSFRLVELLLDGSGAPSPVPLRHQRMMVAAESRSAPPPPIERGVTTIRLGASATIALER